MNRTIIILLLFGIVHFSFAQNPFMKLKFDEVKMFEFHGGKGGDMSIIDQQGNMAKSITNQIVLDKESILKLNKRLGSRKSYGKGEAACYSPRLAFVYYDQKQVVAKVDICLECNRLRSSLEITAQNQGKMEIENEIFYGSRGMSTNFKRFIRQLILKYNFKNEKK